MRLILFAVATLGLTAVISYLTFRSGQLLKQVRVPFNLMLSPVENAFRLLLIGICVGLGWMSGLPAERLGWSLATPLVDVTIGLGFGVLVQSVLHPITRWAVDRFGKDVYSPVVMLNILPDTSREWILVPLALIPAALVEELLFRCLLLGGLSVLWPPLVLVIGSSLLFGLMHAPQGPLGMAVTATIGVVLAFVFLWSGSVLAAFAMHYAVNLLQLVRASRERGWLREHWAID